MTGGGSVSIASRKIRDKIVRMASHFAEVPEKTSSLPIAWCGERRASAALVPIREIARRVLITGSLPKGEEPGLDATAHYEPPAVTHANATHVVTVEVDVETGEVGILRYIVVEDCGTMINPMVIDGQIQGGVAQGIGMALFEQLAYDENGQF